MVTQSPESAANTQGMTQSNNLTTKLQYEQACGTTTPNQAVGSTQVRLLGRRDEDTGRGRKRKRGEKDECVWGILGRAKDKAASE